MFLAGDILLKSQIRNFELDNAHPEEKVSPENTQNFEDDEGAYEYIQGEEKPVMISSQTAKSIVNDAMQKGYTAKKAAVVYRAQKAYESNGGTNINSTKSSSFRSYTVSD